LAKDAKLLIAGGYTIEKMGLMDLFAQTKHVETMVLFLLDS
jgi:23S rRNA (uracil1939-C5)-methyltransferase